MGAFDRRAVENLGAQKRVAYVTKVLPSLLVKRTKHWRASVECANLGIPVGVGVVAAPFIYERRTRAYRTALDPRECK